MRITGRGQYQEHWFTPQPDGLRYIFWHIFRCIFKLSGLLNIFIVAVSKKKNSIFQMMISLVSGNGDQMENLDWNPGATTYCLWNLRQVLTFTRSQCFHLYYGDYRRIIYLKGLLWPWTTYSTSLSHSSLLFEKECGSKLTRSVGIFITCYCISPEPSSFRACIPQMHIYRKASS